MTSLQRLRTALLIAATVGLTAGGAAHAATYTYTALATSDGLVDPFGFGAPVLNGSGVAAFNMSLRTGLDAIVRSDGTTQTIIASDRQRFSRFGDPTINAAGQVGFEASLANVTGEGIFRGAGGPVVQIAGTRDAGDFDFVNAGPSINARGTVAFIGERIVGTDFVDGVWRGSGGAVTGVYDDTGAFTDFVGNPAINDSGLVAFLGDRRNGTSGLYLGRGGPTFVTAADDTGLLVGSLAWSDPSLNDLGHVAFNAGTNEDFDDNGSATGHGVFVFRDGVLETIVQGGFDEFASFGDVSLNNLGEVAFVMSPEFGNEILVTGADPVADRVIGTGDTLLGRTVSGLVFSREGLNDKGQLAFLAFFDDGEAAIVLATPAAGIATAVPEPGTWAMLLGGLAVSAWIRRRRSVR